MNNYTTIYTAIRTLFGLFPSTTRAIASLTDAIAELDAVASEADAAIDHHVEAAELARKAILSETQKSIRAFRIANKLRDLIGG